ncbi:MAG: hypothetical protein KCHDKBKB_00524 [Elusimicrobia bacterium]|nr:hypothetical protein [Elusimicrobiota bacterium]
MRRQSEDNDTFGGALRDRYSFVEKLVIEMEFLNPEGHMLGSEIRSFNPPDSLKLWVTCPGQCGNGRLNLETKISQILFSKKTISETKDICNEIVHIGANASCRCELRCRINVGYAEEPQPQS